NQHPYESTFLLNKAQLYMGTNRLDRALEELDRVSILEPNNGEAFLLRGNIALVQGGLEEGEQLFLQAIEMGEDSAEAYFQIAELYQIQGAYEKAISELKESRETKMETAEAL